MGVGSFYWEMCMDRKVRARLHWVRLYEESKDAGFVCRRCGISRPTLRKWYRRYQVQGIEGLSDQSKKPHFSPNLKLTDDIEKLILQLRKKRKLGARRIQNELKRLYSISLSLASIHKVLSRNKVKPLRRNRRRNGYRSYSRPVPGDRVQMDTKKLAPGKYQYTAIDDCTRWRVLGIYSKRTAANTLLFIDRVIEEFPFPVQRIQTDRGREFFALKVQKKLMEYCIKFRPIKPRSPHLNGKVERSQKTDMQEFYSTVSLNDPNLETKLEQWQFHYNWHRPHGSLNGKAPIEKCCDLSSKIPFWDDVEARYDDSKERFQEPNYWLDLELRKLKPCL
jgi:transposase InsO family protein